jgi:hypothetical protein
MTLRQRLPFRSMGERFAYCRLAHVKTSTGSDGQHRATSYAHDTAQELHASRRGRLASGALLA